MTKLILALALGIPLVPAVAQAEETMYEWQQRQDLEDRIDRLEQAQRDAESAADQAAWDRVQAEIRANIESGLARYPQ